MKAPTVYNTTMTTADTEYSQALPAGTGQYQIRRQDGGAMRLAYVTGKVAAPTAPYLDIPAGHADEEVIDSRIALTLYFAADDAAKVAEIKCWQGS